MRDPRALIGEVRTEMQIQRRLDRPGVANTAAFQLFVGEQPGHIHLNQTNRGRPP